MDWSKGFSSSYYIQIVDPATWRDVERIEITEGSVTASSSGLMQSADVKCTAFDTQRERWIRIYLDAAQGQDAAHIALFTGLTSVPEKDIDGTRETYPLACYSVLKPAEDVLLDRGYFAPRGFNGAELAASLLSVSPAPIVVEEYAPTLTDHIIAESGETRLSMALKVLDAINWKLRISGDGRIEIGPPAERPVALFGLTNDVIEPSVSMRADWYKCPNVFRAISGDSVAVARDDDPASVLSIPSRGREVWDEETEAKLNDGESLEQYARRRLAEEQAYARTISYKRRFDPGIRVGDVISLHYPGQGLVGLYSIQSQTIQLTHGAQVTEEVAEW